MTEEAEREEREKAVVQKLSRTKRGETVCLAWWEVEILLKLIAKGGNSDG